MKALTLRFAKLAKPKKFMVSSCALRFFFGLGVGAFFFYFFLLIPFLFYWCLFSSL